MIHTRKYILVPGGIFVFCLIALLFTGCTITVREGFMVRNDETAVVFLVRHAEKVDESRDPDLTRKGYARARELASILEDAGIERIHSTDFIRTRRTAEPLASLLDMEVELYEDLNQLAEEILISGGRHLVVGHSSTTPTMIELLGGGYVPAFDERREYDRLYVVTILSEEEVQTVLLRYGSPSTRL